MNYIVVIALIFAIIGVGFALKNGEYRDPHSGKFFLLVSIVVLLVAPLLKTVG